MSKGRKRKARPVTVAGAMGRVTSIVRVQDPYERPGVLAEVTRAISHSPLDYLLARGRLHGSNETPEDGQARHVAGTRMQGIYEDAGGRGAGAIDYGRLKVDISGNFTGTPEFQIEALSELAAIRRHLGASDYDMLHAVCCEQINFMTWVNSQWPGAGRETRLDAYSRLRSGLDSLMDYFGVAIGPERRRVIGDPIA